jgi:hypothetical protein
MNLRKLLVQAALIVGLPVAASAGQYTYQSFINGLETKAPPGQVGGKSVTMLVSGGTISSVSQTNGFTNTPSGSNIFYYVQAQPYAYTFGTNYTLVTNALLNPIAWNASGFAGISNGQGSGQVYYIQHQSFSPITITNSASTNTFYDGPALVDVKSFNDASSNPGSATIFMAAHGTNSAATNTVKATFAKLIQDTPDTLAADEVTLTVTLNGTNEVTATTNLYAAYGNTTPWLIGVPVIHVVSVVSGTNSSPTDIYVDSLGLSGFIP